MNKTTTSNRLSVKRHVVWQSQFHTMIDNVHLALEISNKFSIRKRKDGKSIRGPFTWLPNFLGWVDYHIFLPMVLRCTRFARESSAIIHAKTTREKNTTYTDVYCIGCVPSSFPRPKVNVSPWPSSPVPSSVLKTIYTAE